MDRHVGFIPIVLLLTLTGFFFFSSAAGDTGGGPADSASPEETVHRYLEALKTGRMDEAGKLTADPDLAPAPATKPCTEQTQRIILENTRWQLLRKEAEIGTAAVEATLDEPDINPLISDLVRTHFAEALQSKGSPDPNERLCQIIGRELSKTRPADIQALPRKTTILCYRLKKLETGWKIVGRESASCSTRQDPPASGVSESNR